MKMNRVAVLLSTLVFAASAIGADESYAIKLRRDAKAGASHDFHCVGSMEQTMVMAEEGKDPMTQKSAVTIDLAGNETISEVDEQGKEKKVVVKVEKCTDAAGKELVAPGAEITIDCGETAVQFSVKDGDLSRKAKEALRVIYTPRQKNKSDDDEIFGTKERKKAGDSWDIDLKKAMADFPMKGDIKDTSGKMTLEKVEETQGKQCLRVSGEMTMKNLTPPGLPEGWVSKEGTMMMKISGLVPTEESLPMLEEAHEMIFKQESVSGPDAKEKGSVSVTMSAKKMNTIKLGK